MAYLVLARKYRPARFDEIVGQDHVTRALKNAIRLDRVAHAFLFTGARGVGKTTAARVLAKALQCENGPAEEPCDTCRACTEITAGNAVDVFEIDGASNRGINEIRELREGVAYAPQIDRYKIYIIDEVHMLTSEAFNALLKTLEEPPRHVKFIFATTEPQKIPVTILSRCQRYDFKRVPLSQVRDHLNKLLVAEEVTLSDGGVRMVARESEGSVRDALSLLDRVISFAGSEADDKAVADCLGIADRRWLLDLLGGLLGGDTATALGVVADVHHYGYDMRAFTADLLTTIRDLIVVKVCGPEARASELSDAEAAGLAELGGSRPIGALQRMFQILLTAADEVAQSRHPRLVLEMALIQCATLRDIQSVPEVLGRLEALEKRLTSGAPPVAAPTPTAPAPQARQAQPRAVPQQQQRASAPPRREEPPLRGEEPPMRGAPRPAVVQGTATLTPEGWAQFVTKTKAREPLIASMLENTVVLSEGQDVALGIANDFYRTQLAEGDTHGRLRDLLRVDFAVHSLTVRNLPEDTNTIASERTKRRQAELEAREGRVRKHPVTTAVVDHLDGEVVAVEPRKEFEEDD
ncbi:MAG: DNA polymerase-3 subunit gamma/tau [Myxococcota bacterium]|jgi:DNA polymerase-3 subunit gamma/tau